MGSGLSASRSPGMTAITGRASAKDSLAERLKPSLPAAPARAPERRRRRRRDEGREERDGAGKPQLDLPESALSLPATRFTHVGFPLDRYSSAWQDPMSDDTDPIWPCL